MNNSIQVKVLNQSCGAGDTYAAEHLTGSPKAAILSCEGACLKGEVARRAANLLAHTIAPDRAVRIAAPPRELLHRSRRRALDARMGRRARQREAG